MRTVVTGLFTRLGETFQDGNGDPHTITDHRDLVELAAIVGGLPQVQRAWVNGDNLVIDKELTDEEAHLLSSISSEMEKVRRSYKPPQPDPAGALMADLDY